MQHQQELDLPGAGHHGAGGGATARAPPHTHPIPGFSSHLPASGAAPAFCCCYAVQASREACRTFAILHGDKLLLPCLLPGHQQSTVLCISAALVVAGLPGWKCKDDDHSKHQPVPDVRPGNAQHTAVCKQGQAYPQQGRHQPGHQRGCSPAAA